MGLMQANTKLQNSALAGLDSAADRQSALDIYNSKQDADFTKSVLNTAGSLAGGGLALIKEAKDKNPDGPMFPQVTNILHQIF